MKICNECQASNKEEAQYCYSCGAPLTSCPSENQNLEQQPPYTPRYADMSFTDAVRVCTKEKYASFEGRATRSEYWNFCLFGYLILIVAVLIAVLIGAMWGLAVNRGYYYSNGAAEGAGVGGIIACVVVGLVLLCPSISVTVRRLHDTGRSGWWYWVQLIPYLGAAVMLIFTLLRSQERDNEYGEYVKIY